MIDPVELIETFDDLGGEINTWNIKA